MISRPAPRGVHTPQTAPAATLYAICNATVGNVNPKRIRTPLRAAAGSQPTCNIILSWPRGPLSLHKASPLNPLVGYPIYQLQQTMSTTGRPSSRHEDATPPGCSHIRPGPETGVGPAPWPQGIALVPLEGTGLGVTKGAHRAHSGPRLLRPATRARARESYVLTAICRDSTGPQQL
jgi:hypothetical protein